MKFKFKELRQNKTVTLNNLFPSILHEFNLTETFVIDVLKKEWSGIVDSIIASHSEPDRIFKNILFITADHPVYSNEILLMKNMIMESISEKTGLVFIKDIRVEVKKQGEKKRR